MVDYYQDTFGLRRLRLEERRCQEGPENNWKPVERGWSSGEQAFMAELHFKTYVKNSLDAAP
jgi:hypothetical protein